MDPREHLMHHLHVAAGAHAPRHEIQLVRGRQRLQQESSALQRARIPAGHDGECPVGGARGSAGNGAVDELDVAAAAGLEGFGDGGGVGGGDCRAEEEGCVLGEGCRCQQCTTRSKIPS